MLSELALVTQHAVERNPCMIPFIIHLIQKFHSRELLKSCLQMQPKTFVLKYGLYFDNRKLEVAFFMLFVNFFGKYTCSRSG